ncbi:sialate O-acetylesterase [Marisediminicola sp. LYQ134]|uniref:sialate O-acetylesterase n=1 Tax=Marisediminicola sp. LYQ134 TaxID=3391061 RepID=UPI003983C87A
MTDLLHTITAGQSLSLGSQGTPSLSTVSEIDNAWLVAADGTTAVPLKSSTQQAPHLSMGYRLGASRPAQRQGFSTHGLGGQSLQQLAKGGASGRYEQSIAAVQAAHDVEVAASRTYAVEAIHWIQGEADQTFDVSTAAYLAGLTALVGDYIADIGAITGQSIIPFIGSQTATWAYYNQPARIGLAQLEAARTLPGVYLVGGQYQFPYADRLHLTNVGYYRLGELHARAQQRVIDTGDWPTFAPVEYTVTPSYIDVRYDVPTGSLEFDTTIVSAQPDMGFSLANTEANITAVSIINTDTVRLALSQPITEPVAQVGYGVAYDNTSVGLGNLCDSTTTTSVHDGTRIANWALHSLDTLDVPNPFAYEVSAMYFVGPAGKLYPVTP